MSQPTLPADDEVLVLSCRAQPSAALLIALEEWLPKADAIRLSLLRAKPVRNAFAVGRLLVGWLDHAAHQAGKPPLLKAGPSGKPAFSRDTPWRFNLSHTADRVILAVSQGREVGVDVEPVARKADFKAVAKRVFHPMECVWWAKSGYTPKAFFQIWAVKEAWVKTGGEGIGINLNKLNLLPFLSGSSPLVDGRFAAELDLGPDFVGRVVCEKGPVRVTVQEVSLEDMIPPSLARRLPAPPPKTVVEGLRAKWRAMNLRTTITLALSVIILLWLAIAYRMASRSGSTPGMRPSSPSSPANSPLDNFNK